MPNNNITILLEVYNEANRLEECLKCFSWAEELVVFVKESSDATFDIAKKMATHVYAVPYCSASENTVSNFALHASKEWCFYITASSRIDESLVSEIEKCTTNENFGYDVIGLPYDMYVMGVSGKSSPWGNEYKFPLIRKDVLKLSTVLHEEISWDSERVFKIDRNRSKGRFYHYTHVNPDDFFMRHMRYVKYEANYYVTTYGRKAYRAALLMLFRMIGSVLIKRRTIYRRRDGFVLSLAYISYFIMLLIYVWFNLRSRNNNDFK